MTESVAVDFIGFPTGITRLLTNLELAGATPPVEAEPGPARDDHLGTREYHSEIVGLPADQAVTVAMAYLATANDDRVWIDGAEVEASS